MVSNTEVFTHPFAEGIIAPHLHGINEAAALLRSSRVLSVDAHVAIGFHRRYVQKNRLPGVGGCAFHCCIEQPCSSLDCGTDRLNRSGNHHSGCRHSRAVDNVVETAAGNFLYLFVEIRGCDIRKDRKKVFPPPQLSVYGLCLLLAADHRQDAHSAVFCAVDAGQRFHKDRADQPCRACDQERTPCKLVPVVKDKRTFRNNLQIFLQSVIVWSFRRIHVHLDNLENIHRHLSVSSMPSRGIYACAIRKRRSAAVSFFPCLRQQPARRRTTSPFRSDTAT